MKAPTAPRGVVCVYQSFADNASNIRGLPLQGSPRYGFRIAWEPTAANDQTAVEAGWAYRVP